MQELPLRQVVLNTKYKLPASGRPFVYYKHVVWREMIAKHRLYLKDGRVTTDAGRGSLLLANIGSAIPEQYKSIVEEFYSAKSESPALTPATPLAHVAGPAEDLLTRVPPDMAKREQKKRGRPPKQ